MLKTENHNVLLQAFENYIRQSDFTHRKKTLHDNPKNRELRKTKGKERSMVSLSSFRFLKTHCFQLRPNDPGAPLGPGGP